MQKSRPCIALCEEPTKSALKSVENSIFGFCCFRGFSVLLFLAAFVAALKTPFVAFESYFYVLGSMVTLKKYSPFLTQKLPKIRELLAGDLYCNIDMELVTGLKPANSDHNKERIPIQMYRDSLSYSIVLSLSALRTSYIRKVFPMIPYKVSV